ncbi:MAG: hypothetical protein OEY36_03590 [Gammaproteobacteria bacterium]|nr:hypothetical protein [Gammaproteobacteria bacterium]
MIAQYIVSHQSEFWLLLGFAMLALEVVTGFSTGVFLFAGLGALTSGLLMSMNILPESWIAGIASTGISTGIITALLWKTLKRLQGDKPLEKDNSSDLVGHEFLLQTDISANHPGSVQYSGINWKVEIDKQANCDNLKAGQRVAVSSVEVGVFKVVVAE